MVSDFCVFTSSTSTLYKYISYKYYVGTIFVGAIFYFATGEEKKSI